MQSNTCLATLPLASLVLGLLAGHAGAQGVAVQPSKPAATNDDNAKGLPAWLIRIPTGPVWIGMTTEKLLESCAESVGQDLKRLDPNDPNFQRALKNTVSELGHRQETVPSFYLGKSLLTNRQYKLYLDKNKEARVPYHWWRWGRKDDYEKKERLEAIKQEFPADKDEAPILYWERHWAELPWEVKDDGKPIDDLPVLFVSWRDAMMCAAWLGMRLPSELEWTRAARGDSDQVWLWGGRADWKEGDHYSERVLEQLQLKGYRDRHLKPVGTVPFATGPFGHTDMVAQVWQWTSNIGYRPLAGQDAFAKEFKKFAATKYAANVQAPLWEDGKVMVKGGTYIGLEQSGAITFHIDARTSLVTSQVAIGVGFRLAKSPKPGLDTLLSMIRSGTYDQRNLGHDQSINLDDQAGIECYTLDKTGFPENYQVLSFAPVNLLTKDKGQDLHKLQDQSQQTPMCLGALVTTVKLAEPALESGIYSVSYRHKGMPKELEEALKAGFKVVQANLKKGDKAEEKPEEWRTVLTKYGIEAKELEDKDALKNIKFVRLCGLQIPTDESCLLVMDCDGRSPTNGTFKARIPVSPDFLATVSNQVPATIDVDRSKDKERVTVKCAVPLDAQKSGRRITGFALQFVLDQAPGTAWRLPVCDSPSSRALQQESTNGK